MMGRIFCTTRKDGMKVLEITVFENVAVVEPSITRVLVWNIADLMSLFSVIGALSKGVVEYADAKGLLN